MPTDETIRNNIIREFVSQVILGLSREEQLGFLKTYAPDEYKDLNRKYKFDDNVADAPAPRTWDNPLSSKSNFVQITPLDNNAPDLDLTPGVLRDTVVPIIDAICDIQIVLDRLSGTLDREICILAISQEPPIEVEIEGVKEALQMVGDYIVPEHTQRYTSQINTQISTLRSKIAGAESALKWLEHEYQKVKTPKNAEKDRIKTYKTSLRDLRGELDKVLREDEIARIRLAKQIIKATDVDDLTDSERALFIMRLDKPLATLLGSPVQASK